MGQGAWQQLMGWILEKLGPEIFSKYTGIGLGSRRTAEKRSVSQLVAQI